MMAMLHLGNKYQPKVHTSMPHGQVNFAEFLTSALFGHRNDTVDCALMTYW
jgi:hypothetical protein